MLLLKARGELPGSVSMLVHTSGMKADHRTCAGYVRAFLQPLRTKVAASSWDRSEEHTSELQSLMRISYAVFCLKKKKKYKNQNNHKTKCRNTYTKDKHTHI